MSPKGQLAGAQSSPEKGWGWTGGDGNRMLPSGLSFFIWKASMMVGWCEDSDCKRGVTAWHIVSLNAH